VAEDQKIKIMSYDQITPVYRLRRGLVAQSGIFTVAIVQPRRRMPVSLFQKFPEIIFTTTVDGCYLSLFDTFACLKTRASVSKEGGKYVVGLLAYCQCC